MSLMRSISSCLPGPCRPGPRAVREPGTGIIVRLTLPSQHPT